MIFPLVSVGSNQARIKTIGFPTLIFTCCHWLQCFIRVLCIETAATVISIAIFGEDHFDLAVFAAFNVLLFPKAMNSEFPSSVLVNNFPSSRIDIFPIEFVAELQFDLANFKVHIWLDVCRRLWIYQCLSRLQMVSQVSTNGYGVSQLT